MCSRPPVQRGGLDHLGDREVLGATRPGGEEPAVPAAVRARRVFQGVPVLGVHDHQPVELRHGSHRGDELRGLQVREFFDTGIGQETLEPEHAGVVQRSQVGHVAGNGTAPEAHVDEAILFRCFAFHLERSDVDRRRKAVQGHVDDRGDAARGGGPGGAGEALPLGATGIVDVHVGVHQAGEQHLVGGQRHDGIRGEVGAEVCDRGDPSTTNGNRAGNFTALGDRPRRVQDQVVALGHDDRARCSIAIRPASRSSSGAAFAMERCGSGSRSSGCRPRRCRRPAVRRRISRFRPHTATTGIPAAPRRWRPRPVPCRAGSARPAIPPPVMTSTAPPNDDGNQRDRASGQCPGRSVAPSTAIAAKPTPPAAPAPGRIPVIDPGRGLHGVGPPTQRTVESRHIVR